MKHLTPSQRTRRVMQLGGILVACLNLWGVFLPAAVRADTPAATAGRASMRSNECTIASSAMEIASKLRSLKALRPVICKRRTKEEVTSFLQDTIRKKIPPQRLKNEERVYKLLGILPQDYPYVDGLVDLYTQQLGGYYDPDRKYYAMAAWMPDALQMPIAVHELTHALQDQHFKLDAFLEMKNADTDTLLARSALVEGDATAVMIDYTRSLVGEAPIENDDSVSLLMLQNISGAMFTAGLRDAPSVIQGSLLFPYVSGLQFAHALLRVGGDAKLDQAFHKPPRSTEEILHSDKWLKGSADFSVLANPSAPSRVSLSSAAPVFSDSFGEFLIASFLGTWLSPLKASNAAAGWAGDRVVLYEVERSSRGILVWDLRWDTEADAIEFAQLLKEAYEKRFAREFRDGEKLFSFVDEVVGRVEAQRVGQQVLLTIGG